MSNHAHTRSGALQESEAGFAAILRESGWISEKDLTAATEYAECAQMDLVEAVVALRFLDEHDSYAALSIAAGVEFVDLNDAELSVLAIRLVPASLAFGRLVVPISVNNHVLTFATCRPFGRETKRELTLATGRQARMMVAQRSSVLDALQHCYPALDPAQSLTDMAEALGLDASTIQGVSARAEVQTTPAIESSVPSPGVERPVRRHRVLVTDDDPVTRIVVKVLLERQGFEVVEAVNGIQALDLAGRGKADLVLMDLNMPEMDGFDAIERLRRDSAAAAIPIIVLTSEEAPEIEHRVLQLGANDYLVKPFDPEVLVSRVRAAVRRHGGLAAGTGGVQRSWGS